MIHHSALHIVSFDIPYPPNYGGVIDVFYKIKALSKLGVPIHLHTFEYGRERADKLIEYCESVHYYKRDTSAMLQLNRLPYIVISRKSNELLNNLNKDDYPILFEGIHTSGLISNSSLLKRKMLIRTHNIEHDYYRQLAMSELNLKKKLFFYLEAKKLRKYELSLDKTIALAAISQDDFSYFNSKFDHVQYIPAFHPNEEIKSRTGKGNYVLYHANLSVAENMIAVDFLINKVFSKIDFPCVIAGKNPHDKLKKKIRKYSNIRLIANPSSSEMENLISQAHINVLPTFQSTGIKLKLLQSISLGRFCLVNTAMVKGTGLESLCLIHDEASMMIDAIEKLMDEDFTEEMIKKREKIFSEKFSNIENAKKLLDMF